MDNLFTANMLILFFKMIQCTWHCWCCDWKRLLPYRQILLLADICRG